MKHKKQCLGFLILIITFVCIFTIHRNTAFAAVNVEINSTNFTDSVFRDYVKKFDKNNDGILSVSEQSAVTSIDVSWSEISSLKGIEYFTSLTSLTCNKNNLTSLNLSKNLELKTLNCFYNKLTTLDLSQNKKLEEIYCYNNELTSLDVSNQSGLTTLVCSYNSLVSLDVTGCTELKLLTCSYNQLTTLNVSQNVNLERLFCISNKLTRLDISHNNNLVRLESHQNDIYTLNISACPYLLDAYLNGEKAETPVRSYVLENPGYYIYVDRWTTINPEPPQKPVISTQPKTQTIASGKKVSFTVEASGEDLEYQWYEMKNGTTKWAKMSGKTSDKLTFATKTTHDGNKYRCKVSNAGGSVNSKAAKLTVATKPVISTQPKAASVNAGKTATFKVTAKGGGLKYQWYCQKKGSTKWTKMSGKTAVTLKVKAKASLNGNKYRCLVKNVAGKVYTKGVKLTVK